MGRLFKAPIAVSNFLRRLIPCGIRGSVFCEIPENTVRHRLVVETELLQTETRRPRTIPDLKFATEK